MASSIDCWLQASVPSQSSIGGSSDPQHIQSSVPEKRSASSSVNVNSLLLNSNNDLVFSSASRLSHWAVAASELSRARLDLNFETVYKAYRENKENKRKQQVVEQQRLVKTVSAIEQLSKQL